MAGHHDGLMRPGPLAEIGAVLAARLEELASGTAPAAGGRRTRP
ncbi:hypothetical protein [Streptomyces altiplanensis]